MCWVLSGSVHGLESERNRKHLSSQRSMFEAGIGTRRVSPPHAPRGASTQRCNAGTTAYQLEPLRVRELPAWVGATTSPDSEAPLEQLQPMSRQVALRSVGSAFSFGRREADAAPEAPGPAGPRPEAKLERA